MEFGQLKSFQFTVPQVVFGNGCLAQLGTKLRELRAKKVLVLTDPGLTQAGVVDRLRAVLQNEGVESEVFDRVEKEPSLENVAEAHAFGLARGADVLIGLGGGSSMDVTKLVAVLLKHGGKTRDYLGIEKVPGRGLPTVLIPTTAGTGSEVSRYAIFDDRAAQTKLGVVSPYLVADLAVVDPELTVTMPPQITASTGVDALIHAVEGYLAANATPLTDLLALEAIRLIFENLPKAFADGDYLPARYGMSYGSLLAGIVLNNAGANASHALAYPIGSKYHLPHGVTCMLTFLEVMECFVPANVPKFVRMAQVMGARTENLSRREAALQAVSEMRKLAEYIEIPHRLSDIGMDRDLIEPFAKSVVANQQRLLKNAPRKLTEKDIRAIYERSCARKP